MPKFALSTPSRGGPKANSGIPCKWYCLCMRMKGPHKLHGYGPWLMF